MRIVTNHYVPRCVALRNIVVLTLVCCKTLKPNFDTLKSSFKKVSAERVQKRHSGLVKCRAIMTLWWPTCLWCSSVFFFFKITNLGRIVFYLFCRFTIVCCAPSVQLTGESAGPLLHTSGKSAPLIAFVTLGPSTTAMFDIYLPTGKCNQLALCSSKHNSKL